MSVLMRKTIGFVLPFCFLATVHAGIDGEKQGASLKTYRDVDGSSYFALSLRPTIQEPPARDRDVVLLVDTSASQTGVYRIDTLEAVASFVSGLRDTERLHLVAIDVQPAKLTDGFVTKESDSLAQGLNQLKNRVPLGATDLAAGLQEAIELFAKARPDCDRTVVYIGDGASRANILALDELEPLVDQLVKGRISVNSYALGVHRDIEMLAVLANHTGGAILIDGSEMTGQDAGRALMKVARGSVLWPAEMAWPASIEEAYPRRLPPLRFDRDSIVIGKLERDEAIDLTVNAELGKKEVTLEWSLSPQDTSSLEDYSMVPGLVESARPSAGLTLPLLGTEGLDEARRLYQMTSNQLSQLGKQALARGDRQGAQQLIDEALRRDPGNSEAKVLQQQADRSLKTKGIAQPQPRIRLAQAAEVLPAVPTPVPQELLGEGVYPSTESLILNGSRAGDDQAGGVLRRAEEERKLEEQIIRTEVTNALAEARELMRRNPEAAIVDLKNVRETVVQLPDLEAGVRAELLDRLEAGLRQGARRQIEVERLDAVARANQAAVDANQRLLQADARHAETIRQYVAQVNSLLDEGRYLLAEEVALRARDEAPEAIAPNVAVFKAAAMNNYHQMRDLFDLKGRRFNDALLEVERAAIPVPDNPPIVYPPADEWGPLTERRKAAYSQYDLAQSGPAEKAINAALQSKTTFEFAEESLDAVIETLERLHGIQIEVDKKALEDASLDPATEKVSKSLRDVSLRSALRLTLSEIGDGLTYVIKNEVLMITTKEKADEELVTKVYPVGDLVMPIINLGALGGGGGGFGGGGLGGGGFGGGGLGGGGFGGGGLGGGGFGGGGFGGGGFGGGGGGFGGGGGGGFFDVEDSIQLNGTSRKNGPAPAKPAATQEKAAVAVPAQEEQDAQLEALKVTPRKNESMEGAWDRYFAELWDQELTSEAEREHFARVRQTVRERSQQKKFSEVVAIIHAALRNGQFQPWMHQTLAMTLQAQGADLQEVERALMSSVDLNASTDDLIHLASYMGTIGLDRRAIQMFRDIAESNPLRPEPYVQVMEAAERCGDMASLRWACQRILEQAWPAKHRAVFDKAVRVARASIIDMEKSGDQETAQAFIRMLNESLGRDCVVRVSWTGEADIDLMIEEPTGTVCSLQSPRSAGGGVLLEDASAFSNQKNSEGIAETYVCPRGFSGEYRVLIRRVWGEVATGKVTIDILTNLETDREKTTAKQQIRQQIDIMEKDALVTFKLENGRLEREVDADQIRLAEVASRHIDMNRTTVLAQEFNALKDDDVTAQNSLSQLGILSRDPRNAMRINQLLAGRGAVGFRPQITTLPEGTMMFGQAVISADRRYARISVSPQLSRVTEVATFNFATGAGGQQQGGGGAGGGIGGGFGGGGLGGGGLGGGGFGGGGLGGGGF